MKQLEACWDERTETQVVLSESSEMWTPRSFGAHNLMAMTSVCRKEDFEAEGDSAL